MRQDFATALLTAAILAVVVTAGRAEIAKCGGTNVEMTACVWEQYEAADAELNAVWREVLASIEASSDLMPPEAVQDWRTGLVQAQRAWAEFKDADCNIAVAHEWYGGTGANAAVGSCLYQHTQDRIDDLRERYLSN